MIRHGLAAVLLLLTACGDAGEGRPEETSSAPYVVTAIDYHFHDAHPSQPIGLRRPVVFSNQGSNVHNVTFPGSGFSENIRPGERLAIGPVSDLVDGPGRHRFVCKLHADRGMSGVLVVVS